MAVHQVTRTTAQQLASQARKGREAFALRDELIHQMHAEGASLRQIAAVAELTPQGVRWILQHPRSER